MVWHGMVRCYSSIRCPERGLVLAIGVVRAVAVGLLGREVAGRRPRPHPVRVARRREHAGEVAPPALPGQSEALLLGRLCGQVDVVEEASEEVELGRLVQLRGVPRLVGCWVAGLPGVPGCRGCRVAAGLLPGWVAGLPGPGLKRVCLGGRDWSAQNEGCTLSTAGRL